MNKAWARRDERLPRESRFLAVWPDDDPELLDAPDAAAVPAPPWVLLAPVVGVVSLKGCTLHNSMIVFVFDSNHLSKKQAGNGSSRRHI